jgi:hypothetical protein
MALDAAELGGSSDIFGSIFSTSKQPGRTYKIPNAFQKIDDVRAFFSRLVNVNFIATF